MTARLRIGVMALLCVACTPRQLAIFREVVKTSSLTIIEDVICSRITGHHPISGGYFDVPKSECKRERQSNGNIRFSFVGSGRFSKYGGLAAGDFRQAVSVEYQVRIRESYFYVVPEEVRVARPDVFNLSFGASIAEFFGAVSGSVRSVINEKMNHPRTIILGLEGQTCIVEGWIAPRTIPVQCSSTAGSYFPRGGTAVARVRAPPGWDSEGLNLTVELAPAPIPEDGSDQTTFPTEVASSVANVAPELIAATFSPVASNASGVAASPAGHQHTTRPPRSQPTPISSLDPNTEPIEQPPPAPASESNIAPMVRTPLHQATALSKEFPTSPPVLVTEDAPPPMPPAVTRTPLHVQSAPVAMATPTPNPRSHDWRVIDAPATRAFVTAHGAAISAAIQEAAYPDARLPRLLSFQVRGGEGVIAVEFLISVTGRALGRPFGMTVIWEFSSERHISAVVEADGAGAVSIEAQRRIDDHFRNVVFPQAAQ